jgi:hypothetical protein
MGGRVAIVKADARKSSGESADSTAEACVLEETEPCDHSCPFWGEGGAVLEAACVLVRLGFDGARQPLARNLHRLRWALEGAPNAAEEGRLWRDLLREHLPRR